MTAAGAEWRSAVTSALRARGWKGAGDELEGRCLDDAHEDGTPSATWSIPSGCGTCHGCGATWNTKQAAERLGVHLSNDTPPGTPEGISVKWKGATLSTTWTYRDTAGAVLGHVARYDGPDGKVVIPYFKRDGDRWRSGAAPVPRPLYGLDRLAARPDAAVLVAEGEKACAAAARLLPDYVATTWLGGAKAVGRADWSPLAGRTVAVWPDADVPGEAAGREVVAVLQAKGCEVALVNVEALGLVEGGDAADLAELPDGELPLVRAEAASPSTVDGDAARRLPFTSAADFAEQTPEILEWLVPPYFPKAAMVLVDGKPKVAGKTSFLVALGRAVVTGGQFLGETATRGPVVYLSEQGRNLLRPYLDAAGLLAERDFYFLTWGDSFGRKWAEIAEETVEECKRLGAALLVVDTVGRWLDLKDDHSNDEGRVRERLAPLKAAAESGLAVSLARHEGKGDRALGEAGLGSTAFQGEVDAMASLRRPESNGSDTARVLHFLGRWEAPERQVIERDHRDHGLYRTCSGVASLDVRVLQQIRCAPGASKRAVCKGVSGRSQDVLATIERLLRMDPPMLVDRGDAKTSSLFVAEMARTTR
jgi:hypothetical protein